MSATLLKMVKFTLMMFYLEEEEEAKCHTAAATSNIQVSLYVCSCSNLVS